MSVRAVLSCPARIFGMMKTETLRREQAGKEWMTGKLHRKWKRTEHLGDQSVFLRVAHALMLHAWRIVHDLQNSTDSGWRGRHRWSAPGRNVKSAALTRWFAGHSGAAAAIRRAGSIAAPASFPPLCAGAAFIYFISKPFGST